MAILPPKPLFSPKQACFFLVMQPPCYNASLEFWSIAIMKRQDRQRKIMEFITILLSSSSPQIPGRRLQPFSCPRSNPAYGYLLSCLMCLDSTKPEQPAESSSESVPVPLRVPAFAAAALAAGQGQNLSSPVGTWRVPHVRCCRLHS